MNDKDLAAIAEKVSTLLQLDRMRHRIGTEIDMSVLANVPDYIASVFEEANAVNGDLTPTESYNFVNKRISQLQAQIYLLRLEMENRFERDPARIFEDPLVISAYGERIDRVTKSTKSFSFEPSVLAYGWHQVEISNGLAHRWMRPGDVSVACVPHLGTIDQTVEIHGYVLHPEQIEGLSIRVGETEASINVQSDAPHRFVAIIKLSAEKLKSANYLPVEFNITRFRQPNEQDTRLLGANISRFVCRPSHAALSEVATSSVEDDDAQRSVA